MSINHPVLPVVHVICIKWGSALYGAKDVNRLYGMVARNMHRHEVRFHCFTEDCTGLRDEVITHPLPILECDPGKVKHGYLKEVGLCDDHLGGLHGQRVIFFDLDVIITDSLDEMVELPQGDDFVIINDWNTRGNRVGQATCYSFKVGTLGFAKKYFEEHPQEVIRRYGTACQEYLSSKVIEKWGALKFWPADWCQSFKFTVLPVWYRRAFVTPELPIGTKVLAFHGSPKIEDAMLGRWSNEEIPFLKRLYKTIRPCPWIAQFWTD